jgi:hypothetical protein
MISEISDQCRTSKKIVCWRAITRESWLLPKSFARKRPPTNEPGQENAFEGAFLSVSELLASLQRTVRNQQPLSSASIRVHLR